MKHCLTPLLAAAFAFSLAGCAGVRVADTQVASGAPAPRVIYIRPFSSVETEYTGRTFGGPGEKPLRQSLLGRQFADSLKLEFEKIAPVRIIEHDDVPEEGWLITGSLELVDVGKPGLRATPAGRLGAGRSKFLAHVKIREIGQHVAVDEKGTGSLGAHGSTIYEFDLTGGSRLSADWGGDTAPGIHPTHEFDFANAAERARYAVTVHTHRYGSRDSSVIR